jgi:amino acid adenylation domain-containing protein
MNLPDSSLELSDPLHNRKSLELQMEYWKLLLKDVPPLELPTDKPRSALPLFNSGTEPFNLSIDLTEGLKALSRREGVTLFMTLFSAFQILLHRYSGQDDIVIGTPTAGRSNLVQEDLIGYFVNTLVLRTDLSGDPSFRELLARVRVVALDAYANQDMPFEKLVEVLNPQRDPSRHPLFQVMFVFQNITEAQLQLNEISVDGLKVISATTKFDLILELSETLEGLTGSLEYATDLFDASTITRLIGHYQTLLEGIIARPEARLSELLLLTKPERQQLLVDWNKTYSDYPKNKCIHQLFEEQVERTPDAIALIFEDQQLSYQILNTKANQLAHYLKTVGVGPDSLVGICLDRGIDMIVGLLAILKAGGAYVPLDSAYPKERLAFMLADSRPVALLINSENMKQFSDQSERLKLICLDAITAPWLQLPYSNLNSEHIGLHSEHLAYVIYTSGSTGQPKGVAMPHGALVNLITWQLKNTRVNSTARTLQYSPISFDVSFQEIFATGCGGGELVLVDELTRHDPLLLLKYLDKNRIERLYLPFIALEQIARSAVSNSFFPDSLREVVTAGEQLRITPEIRGFFAGLSDCQLVNQYGPTETHVVTAFALPLRSTEWETLPPIGRPIANTQIYILDSNGEPVPVGIKGELYIGGACVARGYLGRSELNVERFLVNPFIDEPLTRIYKTGDLARWRNDGMIEFIGRNDFQVKIRGFRIELGDIETGMRQHPQLREVVVSVYEPILGDKRLVAYLVPEKDSMPSASELRDFLKNTMPDYMVPSVFIFLEALPLTPNGKLDRKALPEPDQYRNDLTTEFIAPRSLLEKKLGEIWAEVLRHDRIGIHDNFFELGGHSLLATQVIVRIGEQLSVGLSLSSLFELPTIAELAKLIEKTEASESTHLKSIIRRPRQGINVVKL